MATLQDIANEFMNFIKNNSGAKSRWYVGITNDIEKRLFIDHKVVKNVDVYMTKNVETEANARELEDFLIKTLKTEGGGGGGSKDTIIVYAYRITSSTVEEV